MSVRPSGRDDPHRRAALERPAVGGPRGPLLAPSIDRAERLERLADDAADARWTASPAPIRPAGAGIRRDYGWRTITISAMKTRRSTVIVDDDRQRDR